MNARASSPPTLPDYGTGVYRRRILLEACSGRVVGELQDDFHHFAVDLCHDGSCVTGVRGGGLRMPWTTCGGSIGPLERLRGLALSGSLRAAALYTDPRQQCTHLFDLAALAVAHAARDEPGERRYDISIPDRVEGRTRASLDLDGTPRLDWQLEGDQIREPAPFAGRKVSDRDFAKWAAGLGEELSEAVQVLRRAVFISTGRRWDFERMTHASQFGDVVGGACHTFSRGQIAGAIRVVGTRRDFGSDTREIFVDGFSPAFRRFESSERAGDS